MNNTNVIVSVNTMNDISNINNNTKYINLSIDSFNSDVINYFLEYGKGYSYTDTINNKNGFIYATYSMFKNSENIINGIINNIPSNLSNIEKVRYLYIALGKILSADINTMDNKNEKISFSSVSIINNIWGSITSGKTTSACISKLLMYLCSRIGIKSELINSDINEITLYKKGNINDYTIYFSQNDLKTTYNLLQNSDSYYASSLLSNNNIFTFEFENTLDITDYYKLYNSSANENNVFIDERLCSFKILGRKPIYENEIMISNFLADYIIRFGAFDEDGNQISFNNYSDILESTLKVNNEKVVISGIYIVNENIKEKNFISLGDKDLLLKYLYTYYVNENYFKISKFSENFVSPGLFDFKVDGKDAQVYLSDEVLENEILTVIKIKLI